MASGVCRRFATLLLCHAATYAAPVLATTPMDGAEFIYGGRGERQSARQASEADFRNMRGSTFFFTMDNNVAHGQNKVAATKTGGAEAVHGAAQMPPDQWTKSGTADRCDSCNATLLQSCNSNNTCCILQQAGGGEYEDGERAMAEMRVSGQHGSAQHVSGGDAEREQHLHGSNTCMRIGSRKAHGTRSALVDSALVDRKNGLLPLEIKASCHSEIKA